MPTYRDTIRLSHENEEIELHIFDYSGNGKSPPNRQLISVSSCITIGTQPLEVVKKRYNTKILKPGIVFEGYYIKTLGPYDYCFKMWSRRRLPFAPLNDRVPREKEPVFSVIIDMKENFAGLACGQNLAFCSIKQLQQIGFDTEVKLPAAGPKVYLKLVKEGRPAEVSYVAFQATPIACVEPEPEPETGEKPKEEVKEEPVQPVQHEE